MASKKNIKTMIYTIFFCFGLDKEFHHFNNFKESIDFLYLEKLGTVRITVKHVIYEKYEILETRKSDTVKNCKISFISHCH